MTKKASSKPSGGRTVFLSFVALLQDPWGDTSPGTREQLLEQVEARLPEVPSGADPRQLRLPAGLKAGPILSAVLGRDSSLKERHERFQRIVLLWNRLADGARWPSEQVRTRAEVVRAALERRQPHLRGGPIDLIEVPSSESRSDLLRLKEIVAEQIESEPFATRFVVLLGSGPAQASLALRELAEERSWTGRMEFWIYAKAPGDFWDSQHRLFPMFEREWAPAPTAIEAARDDLITDDWHYDLEWGTALRVAARVAGRRGLLHLDGPPADAAAVVGWLHRHLLAREGSWRGGLDRADSIDEAAALLEPHPDDPQLQRVFDSRLVWLRKGWSDSFAPLLQAVAAPSFPEPRPALVTTGTRAAPEAVRVRLPALQSPYLVSAAWQHAVQTLRPASVRELCAPCERPGTHPFCVEDALREGLAEQPSVGLFELQELVHRLAVPPKADVQRAVVEGWFAELRRRVDV